MTRTEVEAVARRIALALAYTLRATGREEIESPEFRRAGVDRDGITRRFKELRATSLPEQECSIRADAEWVARVLAEAFGVDAHDGSPPAHTPPSPSP